MTTDMRYPPEAGTDRDTVTKPVATATDAATMVTTDEAARIAGVSVRTIRRWIQQGHLACVGGDRGKLVSPADLTEAKKRAGRGHDRRHDSMAADTVTDMTAPALSSSATAQMEAIRDQWLRPLVDRIEELSRENGRLEHERDALRAELAAARAMRQDAPQDAIAVPPRDERPARASETRWAWWRRLFGQ